MEVNNKCFADSNYFVALFNNEDAQYSKALEVARSLDAVEQKLVISNFIFLEIVTVLSQKRYKQLALEAGEKLLYDHGVTIVHMTFELQQATWQIFQEIKQKDVSFVDCSVIACMKAEGINKLLTFDTKDFKILQKYHRFGFFT